MRLRPRQALCLLASLLLGIALAVAPLPSRGLQAELFALLAFLTLLSVTPGRFARA